MPLIRGFLGFWSFRIRSDCRREVCRMALDLRHRSPEPGAKEPIPITLPPTVHRLVVPCWTTSRPTPELFQRPSPPAQPFEYLAQLANFLAVPGPVPGPLRCERRLIETPRFRHQRLELRIP